MNAAFQVRQTLPAFAKKSVAFGGGHSFSTSGSPIRRRRTNVQQMHVKRPDPERDSNLLELYFSLRTSHKGRHMLPVPFGICLKDLDQK